MTETKFIADTNFFIQGDTSVQAPETIITTQEALDEIKDKKSRRRLEYLGTKHRIVTKVPSSESVEQVLSNARDSGNEVLLSSVDINLVALALDYHKATNSSNDSAPTDDSQFDTWITAESFGKVQEEGAVLCTSDATMQCVALLVGLNVISSTGTRVAEVKRWLLRCSACGFESFDGSLRFCPECGHPTLVRYALVLRNGVERELPLPKRFEPNTRGKKYIVPMAKGGRQWRNNIILSEDMLSEAERKWRWRGKDKSENPMSEGHQFFEPRRKAFNGPDIGFGKRNPNAPHKHIGKKKHTK